MGLLTPGISPLTCCCCCGNGPSCLWTEPWDNLNAWTDVYQAEVSGNRLQVEAGHDIGYAEHTTDGSYTFSFMLYPSPIDDGSSAAMAFTAAGLFDGALSVSGSTGMGNVTWFVGGLATPGGLGMYLVPSNPNDPQLVTVEWNDSGYWAITVGDDSTSGSGLGTVADFPTKIIAFLYTPTYTPTSGDSPQFGPITATCTQLDDPLVSSFGDVLLGLNPLVYFPLDQTGAENPVDSVGGVTASLNAPYTWGVVGPVDGLTALDLAGGSFNGNPRTPLTGSQSRLAFVRTTSTDSVPAYDGDAALTVFGDTDPDTWDSFGVSGGKAVFTRFNGTIWQTLVSTAAVNDGNWHMIVVTYDSNTLAANLYVDGVPDSGGFITAHQAKGGILQYGRGYDVGDNFDGSLAQLAVWGRVLTPTEIAVLWAAA